MTDAIIKRDLQHIWHPCSQMKDYETFKPLVINKAYGPYLELNDGRKIIDAISSWWCKSLGHNHARLKQALLKQSELFEHVILANTTNETIVALSEKLASLTHNLNKVFYAGDGSCAVEIAMKMSLHARKLQDDTKRNRFMALASSYHGETCAALSVSDEGIFRDPYQEMLFDTVFIQNIPYVTGKNDSLWHDCSAHWTDIEQQLEQHAEHTTAIIVEPILQGAGGMLVYSKDFLYRLREWTYKHNIHLIADEIMTGIGRTGPALACEHAAIEPDFVCLSKGLTSGWLPMSVVLTSDKIYDLFYDDYETGKTFFHSHTFTGNALAASIALECLLVMEQEKIYQKVQDNEVYLQQLMAEIAENTGKLNNIRGIGAMVAADLILDNPKQRVGYAVYQKAVELGALLRPLGNTIYWLPPLNTDRDVLKKLQIITEKAIQLILK
ncbi:MAG: adenosylmethionine-8-amino-7-oxononanoate aminotransferase [Coxiella sp. DG_40]|nr:MAG: adenosylmethionine-8-amino-7-oxononanoate aminotransferase [Coxiella sp. DG_40]